MNKFIKGISIILLVVIISACSAKQKTESNKVLESQFSVKETIHRLESDVKERGIPVFAKFDHALNAEQVNLELRPTTVLVFGSPKVGTELMQKNQSVSIELPLRIAVWEDEKGKVWIEYPILSTMAENYQLEKGETLDKMQTLLASIASKAAQK